jgi:uncharacterized protein
MASVAISGASGLIGSALARSLESGGHRVLRLVRGAAGAPQGTIGWDPATGRIDRDRMEGLDALVHLAGASIANGRFGAAHKRRIRESRIQGTRLIAETLARLERPPRVLVSASAVGYYGDRGDEMLDETSAPGFGFVAATCREWEQAAQAAEEVGIRVVHLRSGIVLSGHGGALARMAAPARFGLSGRLGHGRQYVSWIALHDHVRVVEHLLGDATLEGPVNAVAPAASTQDELSRTLAHVLHRPRLVHLPAGVVRLLFGEMGRELLLSSACVVPLRLIRAGFEFRFGELAPALRFELGLPR